MTAFSMTLAVSVLLTIAGTVFAQQIVDFSGASKLSAEMREMSKKYLFSPCRWGLWELLLRPA